MLQKYKAVIFDYDDTLVQTLVVKWDQHIMAARKFYDKTITEQDLRRVWGMPHMKMLTELYGSVDSPENISKNYASLDDEFPKPAHVGAIELMNALMKEGKLVGIISSMYTERIFSDFKKIGFDYSELTKIQGEEDTQFHKPDPRVFEPTIAHLAIKQVNNSETVYIGDAIRDQIAAKAAGIDFIGVTTGLTSAAEFDAEGIRYVNSLWELVY